MKKCKLTALISALVLLVTALALPAAAEESMTGANLSGTGRVSVPADSAIISFELLSSGSTQARAQKESQKAAEMLAASITADFGEAVSLREVGYYTGEGFSGTRFLITRTMMLSTSRPEEADALRDYLIAQGVSSVFDVSYACHDLTPYRDEALRLAIADAKRKAEALGITLPAVTVRERGCFDSPFDHTLTCEVEVVFGKH